MREEVIMAHRCDMRDVIGCQNPGHGSEAFRSLALDLQDAMVVGQQLRHAREHLQFMPLDVDLANDNRVCCRDQGIDPVHAHGDLVRQGEIAFLVDAGAAAIGIDRDVEGCFACRIAGSKLMRPDLANHAVEKQVAVQLRKIDRIRFESDNFCENAFALHQHGVKAAMRADVAENHTAARFRGVLHKTVQLFDQFPLPETAHQHMPVHEILTVDQKEQAGAPLDRISQAERCCVPAPDAEADLPDDRGLQQGLGNREHGSPAKEFRRIERLRRGTPVAPEVNSDGPDASTAADARTLPPRGPRPGLTFPARYARRAGMGPLVKRGGDRFNLTGHAGKALQCMNIFEIMTGRVAAVLADLAQRGAVPSGLDLSRVVVEPPRDASHGDLACNAAMALARDAGLNPRQLADLIVAELSGDADITAISVAGPGFINLSLRRSLFETVLRAAIVEGADFGKGRPVPQRRVNVEYVSANPTGPMHVGHGRGAVFGDALANLLAFAGRDVTREYYINDAGAQVDALARSAFLRYREALGEAIGAMPEGLYPGDYLILVGQELVHVHGAMLLDMPEAEWLPIVRGEAIGEMMHVIRQDLEALGVVHTQFFSERSLQEGPNGRNDVAEAIEFLRQRGLIYEGRLPPPKGQKDEDWEDREQTLFRSTQFGDDVDRPLLKSDGGYTYFASDIAYHKSKFDRGFAEMIDVWGADHGGYVKRMQAAVKAVTAGEGALDVKLIQLVKLMRNGEPVKMSKRSGDFVTLREVIDEVGRDAVRFMMLFRKNDAPLEFDLAKVREQSKDNPVFYVQYAHARCASIFRQALEAMPDLDMSTMHLSGADLILLADEGEMALVRLIAQYPRQIEQAAAAHEPHRVAFYLYDLAQAFHAQWNRGKDDPDLRFVNHDQRQLTRARLALVHAVRSVLASGLGVLGVSGPDEMR